MGDRQAAHETLCQSKYAKKIKSCATEFVAVSDTTDYVTREELDQRDRELIRHGMGK